MASPVWVCTCALTYTAATSGVWPEGEVERATGHLGSVGRGVGLAVGGELRGTDGTTAGSGRSVWIVTVSGGTGFHFPVG